MSPLNEINYWRKQVVQLHSIMNQLRLPSNRAVIYLLNIAASPRSLVTTISLLSIEISIFRNGKKSIGN
jgi:hypothetical protein